MSLTVADDEARHGEMRHGQDSGSIRGARTLCETHLFSKMSLTVADDEARHGEMRHEPAEESSSASTSESWDCANADEPYFSHEHPNVGQTTLVLAKKGKLLVPLL
ncbi:hypothetical protein IscW_ISCW022432 [Ixodes scapularis]|uniref:Uncharacterized protein n=1 Tax=Ixodes scapularis TaxID=6945 RepID=B7QDM6_IXOSC|nr:hypothetical protein IscW_ISCW022432 [Ixodes scapularis]|eukprot:XP_002413640.1 hypothetical protein IscW_ISCW022432 [Ixodes scapularis]